MSCIITHKGKKYSEEQFKEYFINNKQEFATSIAKNKDVIDSFERKMEGIDYAFSQSPELASIGSKVQYLQYLSTIFPNSKVKDIVYHGSLNKIEAFDKTKLGQLTQAASAREGFFFTNNPLVAESYAVPKNLEETEKGKELIKQFDTTGLDPSHEEDAMFIDMYNSQIEQYRDDFDFDAIPYKKGFNKMIGWKTSTIYEYYSEVYFSLINLTDPKVKDFKNEPYREESYYDIIISAKKENNDGVVLLNTYDGRHRWNSIPSDVYTVFEPEQIHILGSKQDIDKFKEWKQNSTKSTSSQYSLIDTKVEEKYFSDGRIQPTKLVIEKVAQSDHPLAKVAQELLKYNIEEGSTITLEPTDNVGTETDTASGIYNRISRNIKLAQFANVKSARFEQTIVHEYLHLLTVDALRNPQYSNRFKELYEKVKRTLTEEEQKLYGYSNVDEFLVALFTDSLVIKSLSSKPSILGKTGTILKDVFDFLLGIIGITKTNTAYQDAFTLATEILAEQKAQYDSLKNSPYYQLDNGFRVTEEQKTKLVTFLQEINPNFKIEVVKNMSVNGLVDVLNSSMQLAEGKELDAIGEEASHVYFEMLPESMKQELLDVITDSNLYSNVLEEYKEVYTKDGRPDFKRIKAEAAAKLLAASMSGVNIEELVSSPSFIGKFKKLLDKIIGWFKGSRTTFELVSEHVNNILNANVEHLSMSNVEQGRWFQISNMFETIGEDLNKFRFNDSKIIIDESALTTEVVSEIQDKMELLRGRFFVSTENMDISNIRRLKSLLKNPEVISHDRVQKELALDRTGKKIFVHQLSPTTITDLGFDALAQVRELPVGIPYSNQRDKSDSILQAAFSKLLVMETPTKTKLEGKFEKTNQIVSRALKSARLKSDKELQSVGGSIIDSKSFWAAYSEIKQASNLSEQADAIRRFLVGIESLGRLMENIATSGLPMLDKSNEERLSELLTLSNLVRSLAPFLEELNNEIGKSEAKETISTAIGNLTSADRAIKNRTKEVIAETMLPLFDNLNKNVLEEFDRANATGNPTVIARAILIRDRHLITADRIYEEITGGKNVGGLSLWIGNAQSSSNLLVAGVQKKIELSAIEAQVAIQNLISHHEAEMNEVVNDLTSKDISVLQIGKVLTEVVNVGKIEDGEIVEELEKHYIAPHQNLELDYKILEIEKQKILETDDSEMTKTEKHLAIYKLTSEFLKDYHGVYTEAYYQMESAYKLHPMYGEYAEKLAEKDREIKNLQSSLEETEDYQLKLDLESAIKRVITEKRLVDREEQVDSQGNIIQPYKEVGELRKKLYKEAYESDDNFGKFKNDLLTKIEETPSDSIAFKSLIVAIEELNQELAEEQSKEDPSDIQLDKLKTAIRIGWKQLQDKIHNEGSFGLQKFFDDNTSLAANELFYAKREDILREFNRVMYLVDRSKYITTQADLLAQVPGANIMTKQDALDKDELDKNDYYEDQLTYTLEGITYVDDVIRNYRGFIVSKNNSGIDDKWTQIFELVKPYRQVEIDALHFFRDDKAAFDEVARLEQEIEDIKKATFERIDIPKELIRQIKKLRTDLDDIQEGLVTNDFWFELQLKVENLNTSNEAIKKIQGAFITGSRNFEQVFNDEKDGVDLQLFMASTHSDPESIDLQDWLRTALITKYKFKKNGTESYLTPQYSYKRIMPKYFDHFDLQLNGKYQKSTVKSEYRTDKSLKFNGVWLPKIYKADGSIVNEGPKANPAYFKLMSDSSLAKAHKLFVKDLHLGGQSKKPLGMRLGYRVPSIEKESAEIGFVGTIADGWKRTLDLRNTVEKGFASGVVSDSVTDGAKEYGVTKRIYVPYTGKMDVNDISNDVINSTFRYLYGLERADKLVDAHRMFSMLERVMKDTFGHEPNRKKEQIVKLVDTELYGNHMYGGNTKKGEIFNTIVRALGKLTVIKSMSILNPMNNIKNITAGNITNVINAGFLFSRNQYTKAFSRSMDRVMSFSMMKYGKLDKNVDYHLFILFNASNENVVERFGVKGMLVREFGGTKSISKAGFSGMAIGEQQIELSYVFATLEHSKVKKFDGTVIPMSQAFELKDNRLVIKSDVNLTWSQVSDVIRQLREFRYKTQGQTSVKSEIEKYRWFGFVMLFRRFIYPALLNRYTGFSDSFTKSLNDMDGTELNLAEGTYRRGYYADLVIMLRKGFEQAIKEQTLAMPYMTEQEQHNVKIAMVELAMTFALLGLLYSLGWNPWDKDNEENLKRIKQNEYWQNVLVLQSIRVMSEVSQFSWTDGTKIVPPVIQEGWRSINVISFVNKTGQDVLGIVNSIGQEYKVSNKSQGIKKGDSKLAHKIETMVNMDGIKEALNFFLPGKPFEPSMEKEKSIINTIKVYDKFSK